ncbi:E3 ubiquitin-protein ligase arih1 [Ixodes scapularis]
MDSEDDNIYNTDSGNESSGEEDDGLSIGLEPEPTTAKEKMDIEDFPFEVLTTEDIVQHMIDSIRDVNNVVEIPPTTTRILLNHFKWDKEKLYERYYDGDQERLFKEAHVVNPYKKPSSSKAQKKSSRPVAPGMEDCEICLRDLPSSMMTGLACDHRFCTECWNYYLTTKIMEEGMGQTISCAAHGCDILVDDQTVMKLIADPKVKLKYQHLITNSFVECNRLLRWCPQPECNNAIKVQYVDTQPVTCSCSHTFWKLIADPKVKLKYQHLITNSFVECNRLLRWCPQPECNNAIKVQYVDTQPVTCSCSHTFCFSCGENWHDPVKCHLLKKWQKKCDDDSETSNWIAANTKECPKCNVTIEKDGGCNHMVCKNQNCKADFCWVCLGPWEPHGSSWYNCNRYDEEEAKAARDAQERSRAALQRYLFYCNRYLNHMQSLKFEHKLDRHLGRLLVNAIPAHLELPRVPSRSPPKTAPRKTPPACPTPRAPARWEAAAAIDGRFAHHVDELRQAEPHLDRETIRVIAHGPNERAVAIDEVVVESLGVCVGPAAPRRPAQDDEQGEGGELRAEPRAEPRPAHGTVASRVAPGITCPPTHAAGSRPHSLLCRRSNDDVHGNAARQRHTARGSGPGRSGGRSQRRHLPGAGSWLRRIGRLKPRSYCSYIQKAQCALQT